MKSEETKICCQRRVAGDLTKKLNLLHLDVVDLFIYNLCNYKIKMVESSKPQVVITGVSGYLGSYVCDTFLRDGTFQVRGTVRDTKNEAKVAPLK